jgi:hypothetical protein
MSNGNTLALVMLTVLMLGSTLSGLSFGYAQNSNTHPLQWEQYYDEAYAGNTVKYIIQTSDGGYAFAATNAPYGLLSIPPSVLLFKINDLGVVEWKKQFNGSSAVAGLVQTSDNGYVLASGGELFKLDSRGNLLWNHTYPHAGAIGSMIPTRDGGYALAGTDYSSELPSIWLIKTDSAGHLQWKSSFGEKFGYVVTQVVQTTDDNYAIVGYAYSENRTRIRVNSADIMLLKISSSGNLLWEKMYNLGISNNCHKSIVQTSDGGYILTDNTNPNYTPTVIKTDSNGSVQWTKTYDNTGNFDPFGPQIGASGKLNSVIASSDGGLVFAGETDFLQVWVLKTDASGGIQWNQTYGDRDQYGYQQSCLIQSSDGALLVGGYWQLRAKGVQFYVAKIQASLPPPPPSPSPQPPTPTATPSVLTAIQTSLILLAVLGVIIVVAGGLIVYFRKRRKPLSVAQKSSSAISAWALLC